MINQSRQDGNGEDEGEASETTRAKLKTVSLIGPELRSSSRAIVYCLHNWMNPNSKVSTLSAYAGK